MKHLVRSPWASVMVGLCGLIIGYAIVIAQEGPSAFARAPRCPAHAMMAPAA